MAKATASLLEYHCMTEFLSEVWHWLVLGVALIVIHRFEVLRWVGISAVAVGLLWLLPIDGLSDWLGQQEGRMLLWVAISCIMIGASIAYKLLKNANSLEVEMNNVRGIIIDWNDGKGKIKFVKSYGGRDVWQATSDDELSRDDTAVVSSIDLEQSTVTVTMVPSAES